MSACIYCQRPSSGSVKRAHIMPEAIVQNDLTLEPGTECDACNAYAAQLEHAFIHHNRIWPPLNILQVPGKAGRPRKCIGHGSPGDQPGMLRLRLRAEWFHPTPTGHRFEAPDPPEYDAWKFRRCLGHIALNYVAWKRGAQYALESRYDALRKFVRYGQRHQSWPYGQVLFDDANPRRQLGLGFDERTEDEIVRLQLFVDDFYIAPTCSVDLEAWVRHQEGREVLYHR